MALNFKVAAIAAISASTAHAYSSLLSACEEFAGLFDTTCGGTYYDDYGYTSSGWATTALGDTITCETDVTNQFMKCFDDSADSDSCVLNRKSCVSCSRDDSDVVWIHVQTNGVPNLCYGTTTSMDNPTTAEIDFKVQWNRSVLYEVNYDETYFDTEDNITALICDETTTNSSNIPSASNFSNESGVDIDGLVGLSIDNVLLHNAL